MPRQSTDAPDVERAVVGQFLDRNRTIAAAELYAAVRVPGATSTKIDAAILRLVESGVIQRGGRGALRPSAALQHLDRLGLVDL